MADSRWTPLPLDGKLFLNSDETLLSRALGKLENAYVNDAGGLSRFPGLADWCDLPDDGRVYGTDWQGDMIVGTSKGRLYRIDQSKNIEDVTGVPISGGGRVIFDKTDQELIMAAGRKPVRFAGVKTEILSEDAPDTTHVGTIDGFVLAPELGTDRWNHSTAGTPRTWAALDTFRADSKPDPVTAMLITPFREIMMCGPDSIEQWERSSDGDTPFLLRWAVGEGLKSPYAVSFADNAVFAINRDAKLIRFSGQTSQPVSDDIGSILETIDDWTDAWIGGFPDRPLNINGQVYVLVQIPNATNFYGTKGFTFLYDVKKQRFSTLWGWENGRPTRWPGWSYWKVWDKIFVGGDGKVYLLDPNTRTNGGQTQRFLARTGHWDEAGESAIDNFRMRIKRGIGTYETEPLIMVRANRDNKGFGRWVRKGLGKSGHREMVMEFGGFGQANTWQFEIACSDDCPIELVKAEAVISPLGH
jgi:hypothetical protein